LRLALARHGLLGLLRASRLDAGGIEETHHAVGRLRALGDPAFAFSMSSFRRASLSFGSSGLK
jgi:hypothetical protein